MKTRERIAAALLALVTAGFAGYSIGATPGSAESSNWTVKQAEAKAIAVLHKMEASCNAIGQGTESWAEANSTMPHGFEIIGQCSGRLP